MCPMGKRPATGGATGDGACCLCRGYGLKVHTSRKYMCHQIDHGQSSHGLVCPNSAGRHEHRLLYCSASACANAGTQRKEKKLLAAAGNGQAPLPTTPPRLQPQTPQQIPLMVSIVANAFDSLAQGFEQSAACAGLADSGTVATALQLALQMATNRLAARAHLMPTSAAGCEVGMVMDAFIAEPAAQHATPAGQRAKPGSNVAISAAAAGNSGSACVGQPVAASTAAQPSSCCPAAHAPPQQSPQPPMPPRQPSPPPAHPPLPHTSSTVSVASAPAALRPITALAPAISVPSKRGRDPPSFGADADMLGMLDGFGCLEATLRAQLETLCCLPIASGLTIEVSTRSNEADSCGDGVFQRIIGAQYVAASLSRRGPWAWTLSCAADAPQVQASWEDTDGVQDHLLNRFVRGYYRFVV